MDCQQDIHLNRRHRRRSSNLRPPSHKDTRSQSISQIQAGQILNLVTSCSKSGRQLRSPLRTPDISRSRSRSYNRRNNKLQRRSESSVQRRSLEGDKNPIRFQSSKIEIKLLLPKGLANDRRELRYIQDVTHCSIKLAERRTDSKGKNKIVGESEEGLVYVRGNLRENNQCIKLLMKRFSKYERK